MRILRRQPAAQALPGEASEPALERGLGLAAGLLVGAATFVLTIWAPSALIRGAAEEPSVVLPMGLSGFALALVACPTGRWRSPWVVAGVAALASVAPVAWRWHIEESAASVADGALGVPSAALGALAGWVIARRWRGFDCRRPGQIVATATVAGAAVVLGSAFVTTAPDPPPGAPAVLEWVICAVAVGGASRLPHAVLTATGVAAGTGLCAAVVSDARWPFLLPLGHALLVLVPGLILQAILELREEPSRRLRRRAHG
jgi:hypothetical protein